MPLPSESQMGDREQQGWRRKGGSLGSNGGGVVLGARHYRLPRHHDKDPRASEGTAARTQRAHRNAPKARHPGLRPSSQTINTGSHVWP